LLKAALRDQFRELHRDASEGKLRDRLQHLRVLDYWCEQYRVDDWCDFVRQLLQKDVRGRVKHETTITDAFTRADAGTLGTSAEGWSWTTVTGTWQIVSNAAANVGSTGSARAGSDLSSTNHYAQGTVTPSGTSAGCGCCVRFATSADTYYLGWGRNNATVTYRLRKQVAGVGTTLNDVNTTAFSGGVLKTEANGSSLTLAKDGATVNGPVTDTSITTGTRCGVATQAGSGGTVDDWSASDLAASGMTYVQTEKQWRGYRRGYYTFK
jgi:hypothetical protein